MRSSSRLLPLVIVGALACTSSEPDGGPDPRSTNRGQAREATAPRPPGPIIAAPAWTDRFENPAMLIGQDIIVEGPVGLLLHSALRTDPDLYVLETKTIEEGFLQRVVARPGAGREVRGHLDKWVLAAENSILILEKATPCDVTVRATGGAFWKETIGGEESGEELEFVGKIQE